ncbi:TolC family protein [Myroides marinus]|uniref:TolC family protein n=1 Tax=Myroides marinus TaxID=703342 RepID=UPI0025754897|nr:TolC family protein [Myroides marinus]MDM1347218.1 TolC family protein [Myroides marinus]MDM1369416.1 TolC family protein [Myroides marinus]MDM1384389.1 TolC family protein [Myroides marinus]
MNKSNMYIYLASAFLAVTSFTATAVAQEQPKDSLAHYLNVALENNPGVKSQKLAYEAFLQKIPQAGAYQDPELSMEFYTKPMDIVGGKNIGNVSVMQMLPWFGTRKSARVEANHMANMQNEQYKETIDNLTLQVYTQWYNLQKLNEQLQNNEENRKLLQQLEQLAIRKFSAPTNSAKVTATPKVSSNTASGATASASSGMGGMSMGGVAKASAAPSASMSSMSSGAGMSEMGGSSASGMSDVLRIGLELIEIENNIESLHSQIKAEKAKFNALLDRDATKEVVLGQIEKVNFLYSEEDALLAIELNNPMLGMITEEGLAYKAKAEMDRKMSYPMIGLGVQYMIIGKTNDMMLSMGDMNGKDMIMPMMTVSLPIFRKKYKAQQEEGKLWWKSSDNKFQETYNTLKSEYYGYKSQLDDAVRVVTLYEKQTTLAQTTYNLIIKEFVTGKSDLTNVIQVQRQLLDYQLKKAEAIANYNTMVASIKKLLAVRDNTQNIQ